MKNRLKKIDDQELKAIFKDSDLIDRTSKKTDDAIINLIHSFKESEKKKISFADFFSIKPIKYAFVLAVMLFIIIPTGFFLFNKLPFFINNKNNFTYFNSVSGQVDIVRDGFIMNILKGDKIHKNDLIKTDKGAVGNIQIGNNIQIKLNEESEIKFNSLHTESDSTSINLIHGELIININKKIKKNFQIDTQYANINVSGTKFKIKNIPGKFTYLSVIQGMIDVIPKFEKPVDKITVKQNQNIIITKEDYEISNINDKEKEKIMIQIDNKDEELLMDDNIDRWRTQRIFIHNYIDPEKSKILGFVSSGNYVITQTEVSIICFDKSGNKKWENTYGEEHEIFFMSIPVIQKDKIFVSSINKKLLILDLKSGKELDIIDSPGNITFGYQPAFYNDILYLPYGNGITLFDIDSNKIIKSIRYNNPTTPVIFNNKLYVTSFIDKSISCFNLNGNKIWDRKLLFRSFNSISVINDMLFIGDNMGNIYEYSSEGKLLDKIKIPSGVISSIINFENNYFVLANNGFLYKLNFDSKIHDKLIEIDIKPEVTNYLFKSISISNEKIFSGSNNGYLIIYNFENDVKEIYRKISDFSVSSTVYNTGDNFFIGTEGGEIFILNKLN